MFDYRHWDIEPEKEIGNDDIVYGNYVDWDRFREENEDSLLESFDIFLPWGERIPFTQLVLLLSNVEFSNSIDVVKRLLDSLRIDINKESLKDLEVQFIERNTEVGDALITSIFDYYGVPSGTQYEYELPEELRFWNGFGDIDEYDFYKANPIRHKAFKLRITEIFDQVISSSNQLSKKSLILSALIVTESLYKSVITNGIPYEENVSDFGQKIIKTHIDKVLRGSTEEKDKLFRELYDVKAPKQPWIPLRNSLAHDIESPNIVGDIIEFKNQKNEGDTLTIQDLKHQLLQFSDELARITSRA